MAASGLAWSEDPAGRSLGHARVDVNGGVEVLLPRAGVVGGRQGLTAGLLAEIRDRVVEAERRLGEPAQLRWRVDDGGALSVDDVGPIDAPLPWGRMQPEGPDQWGWDGLQPHAGDRWSRGNAGEVFPGVMTPLTWYLTGAALDRAFAAPWGKLAAGRRFVALFEGYIYFNFGLIMSLLGDQLGMRTSDFLVAVGGPEAAAETRAAGAHASTRPNYWRILANLPFLIRRAAEQRWLPIRWRSERKEALRRWEQLRQFNADAEAASDREIINALTVSGEFSSRFVSFLMRCQGSAFGQVQFLLWVSESWIGDRSIALRLLQGLPNVLTAQSNLELWRLAERAAADPRAAALVARTSPDALLETLADDPDAAWLADELTTFLAEHGHRTTAELELATPRWVEEPASLLQTFRGYVEHPEQSSPARLHERQVADRRAAQTEARAALTANPIERLLPARWLLYRLVIRDAQELQPLRENPKYVLMKLTLEQRRLYLLLGRRWQRSGALDAPEDVFWLSGDETLALARESDSPALRGRMRSRVRRRRRQYDEWAARAAPPLRDRDGTPVGEPPAAASAAQDSGPLRGIAASTGLAQGRARVATSPAEGRQLVAGEILVARFTDPGWTPIFPLAAAVVTEIGGMLSHGAVVAREYGIPAVVNVAGATSSIQTGDLLEVDGSTGEVRRIE